MRYGKLFCLLSFSAIAILGSGLPALSQDSNSETQKSEESSPSDKVSETSESERDCFSDLKNIQNEPPIRSKRVELYYYRNAENIVDILSKLSIGEGCVTTLPLNNIPDIEGKGVGRGGGNIILLYGTDSYIENAQRFITSLDLPLPGIDLQMWGVQISSKDPDKLAKTMSKVRWRIAETRRLLGDTLATIEGVSQATLQGLNQASNQDSNQALDRNIKPKCKPTLEDIKVDSKFTDKMKKLGYEDAVDGLGGESSILEVFLVGLAVEESTKFYQHLYNCHLAAGHI